MSGWTENSGWERDVRARADRGLQRVGQSVADSLRQVLAVPGPEPSKRGEPPHRQTGALQGAVDFSLVGDSTVRVGIMDEGQMVKAVTLATSLDRAYLPAAIERVDIMSEFARGAGK